MLNNNNSYNKNSQEENYNNYSNFQTNTNNSKNNFDNNSSQGTKLKYNFNQDIINNIHKVPKSSGLNFNTNKVINNFQFQFKDNEMNDNLKMGVNDFNFDRKKYTINDSINVNGLGSPSINIISIKNNINKENNEYNLEKERRKQDLLQMINFSSNLGINNHNFNSLKK